MIPVLALTQLAFLTLGVVLMRIAFQANGGNAATPYARFLVQNWMWFYLIPLVWIAYAHLAQRVNRFPLLPGIARGSGVLFAVIFFVFFVTVTFVPFR